MVVNYTRAYSDGSVLRAELVSEDGSIVRVVVSPPGSSEGFLRYELRMPQPTLSPAAGWQVAENTSHVVLSSARAVLTVSKAAPMAALSSPEGRLLSSELAPLSREPESQCGEGHGGPIAGGCWRASRSLQSGEQIYGFGLQRFATNHVKTTKWIQTLDTPSQLGHDHAPAPFFLSSLGYGVAMNTHSYSYFDVGFAQADAHFLHSADPVMDLFFFAGPSVREVMGQYTQLYGRTALPPKFALGLWYHPELHSNQTAVAGVVDAFAAHGVPLAALTLEPPWQTHAYACTYVVDPATFWDFPGFMARMQGNGTAVSLWQHAYIYNASAGLASPLWEPVHGGGLASSWITWGGATPDWTLSATRAAILPYMQAHFVDAGVAAFKLDECDGNLGGGWFFPDNSTWPSGFTGAQMHNIFALTYSFAYHGLYEALGLRTFLKARANYMGGSRWATTLYSDTYDYAQYIAATANSGFASLTWAPELRDAGSPSEFARRAQLMLLSGIASEDGWNTGYAPFPPDVSPASAAIYRKFYGVRAELAVALYAAYDRQWSDGLPCVRHPVVDFGDAAAGAVADEYMLASLLVAPAPINATARSVYFPAPSLGWVSFFAPAGAAHAGGSSAVVAAPDEDMPVFQQVGSTIPLAAPGDATLLRLRAIAPPRGHAPLPHASVYDDDGRTTRYRTHGEFFRAAASLAAVTAVAPAAAGLQATRADAGTFVLRVGLAVLHASWAPAWTSLRWEIALPLGHEARATPLDAATAACTRGAGAATLPAALAVISDGLLALSVAADFAAGVECEVRFGKFMKRSLDKGKKEIGGRALFKNDG